jgi:type II secretory pathway component PulF
MQYHFIATQKDGKIIEEDTQADSVGQVLDVLASRGLRPISVKQVKGFTQVGRQSIFSAAIDISDQVFLTKYLALMLKVGMDLFSAIDILIQDFEKPAMKALLIEIRGGLEKGQPFYSTFAKYPKYFTPVFVNLVKAGEASGNLEHVLQQQSTELEKQKDLMSRVRGAFIYPIILLCGAGLVLFGMITFVIPGIAKLFIDSGIQPPFFSQIVFSVGFFLRDYILIVIPFIVAMVFGVVFMLRTLTGKRLLYRLAYILPVISGVMEKVSLQSFATTLSSLLKAGVPILQAIEITADTLGSPEMRLALMRVSKEGISKGLTIGDAFRREAAFPHTVRNLVAISEKAGHLDEVLGTLSTFYESEIDGSIKILISFLEPVLLAGIAMVIGGIALSIILPIYQLVGNF